MMRYAAFVLSLLLVPMPLASASDIDRYLESTTVVVAQIDVSKLKLSAILDFIRAKSPAVISNQARTGFELVAGGVLQSLRDVGVTRVYATLSTLEFTNGQIAIIVPTQNPEQLVERLEAITQMLPGSLGYEVHSGRDAVLVATQPVWTRLAQAPSAHRPELSQAIERIAGEPASLAFNIRDDLRNSVVDVFPNQLPPWLPVRFSPKQLMEDIVSVQLTLAPSPELQINLTATCRDTAAAQRTAVVGTELLKQFQIETTEPRMSENNATVTASKEQLEKLIDSLVRQIAEIEQGNKLKQVSLALHAFESSYRHLPPRMTVSEQGKPLLSWRVFLLPYLGETALYQEFHLDEPWDSPHNRKLVERMPQVYRSLQYQDLPPGHTLVQMPLLPGSVWSGNDNRFLSFKDFTFSTSETVCFVVAPPEKATIWTKPDDLTLRPESLVEDLFGHRQTCDVAMFDGAVLELPRTTDAAKLKVLIMGSN